MNDVIIIGKGPAGISAAIYLARAGYKVMVIGKDGGALEKSDKIENYYGFPEPITGADLIQRGEKQAKRLGVSMLPEEVVSIESGLEEVFIKTDKSEYKAKALLLATGKSRAELRIKGFEKLKGKGISFCAVCDGFFFRNKALGVIGSGDYMASEVEELMNFSKDITVFTNGDSLKTNKLKADIKVIFDKLDSIEGQESVASVKTQTDEYPLDGIFVAIGTAGAADFAAKLGIIIQNNNITADEGFMTNVPGIFAAGDCIGGFLQISKAVADGANASLGIIKYLKAKKAQG